MTDWPSTIPVTRKSYVEKPADRTFRSNMDVGPDKIRRRSSAQPREVEFKLFLTNAQIVTLDAFYDTNDVLAFNFTDPRTEVVKRARFSETPKYPYEETHWNVSVKLEYLR